MAAMDVAETISSLDSGKIPEKLQCPGCAKFLLDGWKLPCCDQSVCATCHGGINDHCPICDHRPMSQDLCKPNKALRNTAKAFLKTAEKKLADGKAKVKVVESLQALTPEVVTSTATDGAVVPEAAPDVVSEALPINHAVVSERPATLDEEPPLPDQAQPSIENHALDAGAVVKTNGPARLIGHEELAARVEGTPEQQDDIVEQSSPESVIIQTTETEPREEDAVQEESEVEKETNANTMGSNANSDGFPNTMNMSMNFSGMDYSQMMQMMAANGMSNFNMMGMPNMGMNPMSQGMFAGFMGPNMGMAGMNGMNMGMNFNANQGMFGAGWNGQNNNMWNGPQSNNPNAFANGMGGDFGSNAGYGYNMSQQGNFHQQQYPIGDFQSGSYGRGYGRGRGRGRGGFGRGRGGYGQNLHGSYPNYQQPHEQQQFEIQSIQAQMMQDQASQASQAGAAESVEAKERAANDEQRQARDEERKSLKETAQAGPDQVDQAVGDLHTTADSTNGIAKADTSMEDASAEPVEQPSSQSKKDAESTEAEPSLAAPDEKHEILPAREHTPARSGPGSRQGSMPPPSAPTGPAAQFADPVRDYGFRGRGQGRFSSRGRSSFPVTIGHPISPVKVAPSPFTAPAEPKGTGVVGAPTGPKAMRAPPSSIPIRGRGGGFQIVGRASMTAQGSASRASETSRSVTPVNGHDPEKENGSRSASVHNDRLDRRRHSLRQEAEEYDDRGTTRRRSKRKDLEDYEMQNGDHSEYESHQSSHKMHRETQREVGSSKHRSSRSDRRREEARSDEEQTMDGYGDEVKPSRDLHSRISHRTEHRSSRSHRREEEEEPRKERRKRSHRDRDDDILDDDDDDSRHRSRRHKRDHHDEPSAIAELEKDPHTVEREARNKERMVKEQQRRESAANAGAGMRKEGRRVSYKYEDEAQSAMVEHERAAARWR